MKKEINMENGTRVRDCEDHSITGIVIGKSHSEPGMIAVEWDDETLERVYEDTLEEYDDQMEKDFETIKEKMTAAITLMEESNALADAHGETIYDQLYGFGLLARFQDMVDGSGWNSSSANC